MAKVKISNRDILTSVEALSLLDRADDKGKPVFTFSASTRLSLAKKKRRLAGMADDINKTTTAFLRQFDISGLRNPDGSPKDDVENIKKYNAVVEPLFTEEVEIEIGLLKYDDLTNGDKNQIPVGVVTALLWMIEETPEDADA